MPAKYAIIGLYQLKISNHRPMSVLAETSLALMVTLLQNGRYGHASFICHSHSLIK